MFLLPRFRLKGYPRDNMLSRADSTRLANIHGNLLL